MISIPTFLASAAAMFHLVVAHGWVSTVTIDGTAFQGPYVNGPEISSGIRHVSSINPTYGAMSADINCGPSAEPASTMMNANPGSLLEFDWQTPTGYVRAFQAFLASTLLIPSCLDILFLSGHMILAPCRPTWHLVATKHAPPSTRCRRGGSKSKNSAKWQMAPGCRTT